MFYGSPWCRAHCKYARFFHGWIRMWLFMYCAGLKHCPHLLQQFIYIRGSRMRYKNVHSVTTVNSWNSPEEPQDWSHCRDDSFRTWTCKVCDNVSCHKELWRTTLEKSIFRTRNCKPCNKELVLRRALKKNFLGPYWWKAFKGFGFVNFVVNFLLEIESWKTTRTFLFSRKASNFCIFWHFYFEFFL